MARPAALTPASAPAVAPVLKSADPAMPMCTCGPSEGLLVLFPCWMEHYVEPHESDEPRITIAFNANRVDHEVAGKR